MPSLLWALRMAGTGESDAQWRQSIMGDVAQRQVESRVVKHKGAEIG
jgi:hypothetical protein